MYFNGRMESPSRPSTLMYCDDCAPSQIPKWGEKRATEKPRGNWPFDEIPHHFGTGFSWAGRYGANDAKCSHCGKEV